MKSNLIKLAVIVSTLGMSSVAYAQSSANANTRADSGAYAQGSNIVFEGSQQRGHTSVSTTPNVYTAPSMFSHGTCGNSSTFGVGVTGFGIGGSVASDDPNCNAREDTSVWARLGLMDVALLRFACFGVDENRQSYEAAGYVCPASATATGVAGAPVGPSLPVQVAHVPTPQIPLTIRGHINQNGSIVYTD